MKKEIRPIANLWHKLRTHSEGKSSQNDVDDTSFGCASAMCRFFRIAWIYVCACGKSSMMLSFLCLPRPHSVFHAHFDSLFLSVFRWLHRIQLSWYTFVIRRIHTSSVCCGAVCLSHRHTLWTVLVLLMLHKCGALWRRHSFVSDFFFGENGLVRKHFRCTVHVTCITRTPTQKSKQAHTYVLAHQLTHRNWNKCTYTTTSPNDTINPLISLIYSVFF